MCLYYNRAKRTKKGEFRVSWLKIQLGLSVAKLFLKFNTLSMEVRTLLLKQAKISCSDSNLLSFACRGRMFFVWLPVLFRFIEKVLSWRGTGGVWGGGGGRCRPQE